MNQFKGKAVITSAGVSSYGRKTNRTATHHLIEATRNALAFCGLSRNDIDGLTTYPGRTSHPPGFSPIGCYEAREALGLKTSWHSASSDGPAQLSPIMIAAMAVTTGMARHVLCFRALTESTSRLLDPGSQGIWPQEEEVDGWLSWLLPMGAAFPANWSALIASRYMHQFDLRKEDLGLQCIQQRKHASFNADAVFKDKPLTLDEYMCARPISEPLGLFDCDVPIDGACVFIVSSSEAAQDLDVVPLKIEAMSGRLEGRDSWDQRADLSTMAAHDVGKDIWRHTDLKPEHINVAALYDGFSIFVPLWLEALGFCDRGEAGAFIRAGSTAIDGILPTNTGGGQLSAGRLHGFGHLHEICVQLWGLGGRRQVPNAKHGICGLGGGPLAGAIILSRS